MTKEAFVTELLKFASENDVPMKLSKGPDGSDYSLAAVEFDGCDIPFDFCTILSDKTAVFCCSVMLDYKVNILKAQRIGELMKQRYGFDAEYTENDNTLTVTAMLDYKKADTVPDFSPRDLIEYSIYRPVDLTMMYMMAVDQMKEKSISPGEAVELIASQEDDICGYFDFVKQDT